MSQSETSGTPREMICSSGRESDTASGTEAGPDSGVSSGAFLTPFSWRPVRTLDDAGAGVERLSDCRDGASNGGRRRLTVTVVRIALGRACSGACLPVILAKVEGETNTHGVPSV
jgi:hypothetical protein